MHSRSVLKELIGSESARAVCLAAADFPGDDHAGGRHGDRNVVHRGEPNGDGFGSPTVVGQIGSAGSVGLATSAAVLGGRHTGDGDNDPPRMNDDVTGAGVVTDVDVLRPPAGT